MEVNGDNGIVAYYSKQQVGNWASSSECEKSGRAFTLDVDCDNARLRIRADLISVS